jgi:methyltransferase (TIGR00027 family)
VFEVDHPASQEDKRSRLAAAGLAGEVSYVDVDFESGDLVGRLTAAGLAPEPVVVSWLGVSMYLTPDAVARTAAVVAGLGPGTELIFDYMLPAELRDEAGQSYVDQVGAVSAGRGEPWLSFFAPDELTDLLRSAGFATVVHSGQEQAVAAAMWDRTDALAPARLATIARARTG